MLTKLLHRSVAAVDQRMILLAPPNARIPAAFDSVEVNGRRHADLVSEMQQLRGGIYLRDGAVNANQLSGGRHQTPEDERSWHLLMVDEQQRIDACVWYMEHPSTVAVDRLRVRNCPLAHDSASRPALWKAVEAELDRARSERIGYAELGGWAVSERSRCTSEGLVLALAGYSLGQLLGGALGMTTATVRHCSSTILRRLGGSDLKAGTETIPSYYDPRYKCEMELLRFDSRRPNAKYKGLVDVLCEKLSEVMVISPTARTVAQPPYRMLRPVTALHQPVAAA
jgi:hypothetical protein